MRNLALGLVIACSFCNSEVRGEPFTGNDILRACDATADNVKQGFCYGYIVGSVEGLKWGALVGIVATSSSSQEFDFEKYDAMSSVALDFCIPTGVENGQVAEIVKNHLRANPQTRHDTARTLIAEALGVAFPCQ